MVKVLPDGGYLVVGTTQSSNLDPGKRGKTDAWLIKLDELGNLVWSKTYGADGNDFAKAAWINPDGTILVLGYSDSGIGLSPDHHGATDGWLMKLQTDGQVVWTKQYGGLRADYLSTINTGPNNTYLLAGSTYSQEETIGEHMGARDEWVLNIDANGTVLWSKTFGGSQQEAITDVLTLSDGWLLGGYSRSVEGPDAAFGYEDYTFRKIDWSGVEQWRGRYGGSENDRALGWCSI
ncbi:MAG: hypothetical protein AAGD05_19335, partial [Bacteroidota bacterium]